MRKYLKTLALIIILAFIAVLAGCGSNDNFSGSWVSMGSNGDSIELMKIKKNGDSYLVDTTTYYYNAEKKSSKESERWTMFWDVVFTMKEEKKANLSAVASKEQLSVNGLGILTYKTDTKTLIFNGVEYKKVDEKDVKKEIETTYLPQLKKHSEEYAKGLNSSVSKITGTKFNDDVLNNIK